MDEVGKQKQALRLVFAMLETVVEMDKQGAPSGPMYVAWMSQGGSLDGYETLMAGLVEAKFVTRSNNCYFATDEGRRLLEMGRKVGAV